MNETTHYEGCYDSGPKHYECALLEVKKLRREWVGLTDDEIEHLRNDQPWWMVRDIEAKLREKNSEHI
jgi:hypothetical protein